MFPSVLEEFLAANGQPTPFEFSSLYPVLAPVFVGLLGVLVQQFVSRRNSKDTTKLGARQAVSAEVESVVSTYKESLGEMRTEMADQRVRFERRFEDQEQKIESLETSVNDFSIRNEELVRQNEVLRQIGLEMTKHIEALEALVPTPPGVPIRPVWSSASQNPL